MAMHWETSVTTPRSSRRRFGMQLVAGALGLSGALGSGLAVKVQ